MNQTVRVFVSEFRDGPLAPLPQELYGFLFVRGISLGLHNIMIVSYFKAVKQP